MQRKSLFASFELFLVFLLCVVLLEVIFVERTALSERLSVSGRADLLDDILSTWQGTGKIYETVSAGGSDFYRQEISSIEKRTGEKLCLYLDSLVLYREDCKPQICSERFFAQAGLLGRIDYRKLELCLAGQDEKGAEDGK